MQKRSRRCLVLAYETDDDLPQNIHDFDLIDAYGPFAPKTVSKIMGKTRVRVFKEVFCLENYIHTANYDHCYISHPDVWGEPRNLMTAIAAISECVNGKLVCEFYKKDEFIAFHFLLSRLSMKSELAYIRTVTRIKKEIGYYAEWTVSRTRPMNISAFYRRNQQKVLSQFYKNYASITKMKDLPQAVGSKDFAN